MKSVFMVSAFVCVSISTLVVDYFFGFVPAMVVAGLGALVYSIAAEYV